LLVKTTVYLDDELAQRLKELVPPRKLNRFINEAVADKAEQLEEERLNALLREGYLATRDEDPELIADWSTLDVEGWPEE
jgi:predicted transcriptional regulator